MGLSGSMGEGLDEMATLLETAASTTGTAADGATIGSGSTMRARPYPLEVDHGRDSLLTEFGKETLKDRDLLPGESVTVTIDGKASPDALKKALRLQTLGAAK